MGTTVEAAFKLVSTLHTASIVRLQICRLLSVQEPGLLLTTEIEQRLTGGIDMGKREAHVKDFHRVVIHHVRSLGCLLSTSKSTCM